MGAGSFTIPTPIGHGIRLLFIFCVLFLLPSLFISHSGILNNIQERGQQEPTLLQLDENPMNAGVPVVSDLIDVPTRIINFSLEFPVARSFLEDSDHMVFLISMGEDAYRSSIVERSLLSIRKKGKFLGPVLLLTDAPVARYQFLLGRDPNLIVQHPRTEDWVWNSGVIYKRFKTYILEYVNLEPRLSLVKFVHYLDIDVIVGNHLQPWFDYTHKLYTTTSRDDESTIIFFAGKTSKWPVQSGQFVLKRNKSERCLLEWRSLMDKNKNKKKDQDLLKIMYQEEISQASLGCKIHLLPRKEGNWLYFVINALRADNLPKNPLPTLIHIMNSPMKFKKHERAYTKMFQLVLDLTAEEVKVLESPKFKPNVKWSKAKVEETKVSNGS